jgi:hypothetical protein
MGLSKLTVGHIWIICGVLAALIGAAIWFLGPYKTKQNLTLLTQRQDDAVQKLGQRKKNEDDKKKAQQEVADVNAEFASYDRRLMPQPPIDLTKPTDETAMTKGMERLWRQPYEICTAADRFAREQAKKNHVTLLSPPFSIAGQPTDPAAIPTTIIELPMGQIQVAGSFADVCAYARAWDQFKRVVALDGFQLAPGPNTAAGATVVGSATVTCYIFPHAPENAPGGVLGGPGGGGPAGPPGFSPPGSPAFSPPGTPAGGGGA